MRYRLFDSFTINPDDGSQFEYDITQFGAMTAAAAPITLVPGAAAAFTTATWYGPEPEQTSAAPVQIITGQQRTDDNSDEAMHADVARATYNLTGATLSTGGTLKIGVISNSFDTVAPAAGASDPVAIDQANGDLPSAGNLFIVQDDPESGGTDEGRAMAELVHRVAPGAQIYFYSAEGGQAAFANGINTLAADGCQIIVDDVDYFAEPIYQGGGIIQTAVDNAVADGVNYFTSVTNNGTDYYESTFNPMSFALPGVGTVITQNISGGSPYESMILQPGTTFIDLQWAQPFASIGGGAGASYGIGVAVYDDHTGTPTFAFTQNSDGAGQDPVNVVEITYGGSSAINIDVAFFIDSGTLPTTNTSETTLFKAIAVNTNSRFTGPNAGIGSGDSIGHNQEPGSNTVGAISYAKTPAFGVTPPVQEAFSSYGPGEWIYNASGGLLTTPLLLGAPNISAPDGSATSVPGFTSGFFGTSAAAPDAAAAAALMLQEDGRLTTKQISYILEATAVSTGSGINGGAGLVQADTAVAGAHIAINDPLWTGLGGNGLWSNAANWSDAAVPGASALVVLGNGDGAVTGAYTATFDPTMGNIGTLAIDGSGIYDPETPSLTIGASHTLNAGGVLLGGFGTLDIGGFLNISGALGTGAESVTAGAVASALVSGPSGVRLDATGRLTIGAGDADGIAFTGSGGLLTFSSSISSVLTTQLTGAITGFNPVTDTIDFTGLTYQSGDSIKVVGGIATIFNQSAPSTALANFPLSGSFSSLSVVPDSGTGAEVVTAQSLNRTMSWVGGGGNALFGTAANWDDLTDGLDPAQTAPSTTDIAEFLTGGGAIGGTGTAAALAFGGPAQWLLGASSTLTAHGAAGVTVGTGGSGILTLSAGAKIISQGTTDIVSGTSLQAASVTVDGTGATWSANGALLIGGTGVGALDIEAGGLVTAGAGMVIANTGSASGSFVEVSGTISDLTVAGALVVGAAGTAVLSLSQGATVKAGSLDVASGASGDGAVSLSGGGTTLSVTGSLILGDRASGELSVLDGARMSIGGGLVGGTGAGASGNLDIEGTGSQLTINTGTLVVGANGPAEFTLGIGATLKGELATGQFGVVNEYGTVDPATDPNDGTQNVGFNNSLLYDFYVANSGTIKVISGSATYYTPLVTDETNAQDGSVNGLWMIGAKDTLVMNSTSVDNTQTFDLTSASAATLIIGQEPQSDPNTQDTFNGQTMPTLTGSIAPGAANVLPGWQAPIENYQAGDVIRLQGLTYGSATSSGDVVTVWSEPNGQGTALGSLMFIDKSDSTTSAAALASATAAATQINTLACFAAGTRIATEHGWVAVEDLVVGDLVTTTDGHREPIVWLGSRDVDCARHPRPDTVWPIRVAAGAFGENVPIRDLFLSPDHAVFLDNVLVPVKFLANGTDIAPAKRSAVTYHHVQLPRHAVILAEGLSVESYLDVGDQANFNEGTTVRLFPDFAAPLSPDVAVSWETRGAAPFVTTGARLERARRTLRQRAA